MAPTIERSHKASTRLVCVALRSIDVRDDDAAMHVIQDGAHDPAGRSGRRAGTVAFGDGGGGDVEA